jgi:hypothetical protein
VRSKITDAKGQLLVDYMIDIETGRQSSWNAENIDSNWSPQPAPLLTPEPLETYVVSPSPTSIPLPLQTNSAPTSTGRSAPYPQPTTSPYP